MDSGRPGGDDPQDGFVQNVTSDQHGLDCISGNRPVASESQSCRLDTRLLKRSTPKDMAEIF